jgi:hypothetical protein
MMMSVVDLKLRICVVYLTRLLTQTARGPAVAESVAIMTASSHLSATLFNASGMLHHRLTVSVFAVATTACADTWMTAR